MTMSSTKLYASAIVLFKNKKILSNKFYNNDIAYIVNETLSVDENYALTTKHNVCFQLKSSPKANFDDCNIFIFFVSYHIT